MNCSYCNGEILAESKFCHLCGCRQVKSRRKNGDGTIYRLPSGKWRAEIHIVYRKVDGNVIRKRRTKSTFDTYDEAEKYLPSLRNEDCFRKVERTLIELHCEWKSTKKYIRLSDDKKSHYKTAWKRLEQFWYYNVKYITLYDMQSIVDKLNTGFYPKRDIKILLNHLMTIALKHELIDRNRATWIELPEVGTPKKDAFNESERMKIWDDFKSGHEISAYALLMIYTGLRPGEVRDALKSKVNMDGGYFIAGIKTTAGRNRHIPIPLIIIPVMAYILNLEGDKLCNMYENLFYDEWADMIKRTEIRTLTPNCCRHTFGSMMIEHGASREVTASIMGHSKIEHTDPYIHISLNKKLEVVNTLNL